MTKTLTDRIGLVLIALGLLMMLVSYLFFYNYGYLQLLESSFDSSNLNSDRYAYWLQRDGVILFFVGVWLVFAHEHTTKPLIKWIMTGSFY